MKDKNTEAFFELLRAGLWEKEVRLMSYGDIDFQTIYQSAEYQTVTGLIASGLEYVCDVKVPQDIALTFAGSALQIEQRNVAMNAFVADIISQLRKADIYTLLVKGQGVAQSYERPLWRSCGDVDLYLSDKNYEIAKQYLIPKSIAVEQEDKYEQHLALTINSWAVELHGRLKAGLSRKVDKILDIIHYETFCGGYVRSWDNSGTTVFLLGVNNDIVYVFSHILQHYFHGGIGLRQICDWCRMLYHYQPEIGLQDLELRIKQMGVMSEWKAFGAFAVDFLGMPEGLMPFYSSSNRWHNKAKRLKNTILITGNFSNRDLSYVSKSPYIIRKTRSMLSAMKEVFVHIGIFPLDSVSFFFYYLLIRMKTLIRGE